MRGAPTVAVDDRVAARADDRVYSSGGGLPDSPQDDHCRAGVKHSAVMLWEVCDMKKALCLLLIFCLCAACALAEEAAKPFELRFDEGFSLSLPEGWVSYDIDDPVIRYALGDGTGERFLYILAQPTEYEDFDAMRAAIDAREDCGRTSPLDLNGQSFAAFIMPGQNASGCATLWNGEMLAFLFTPQDNTEYMVTVAEIMASFK